MSDFLKLIGDRIRVLRKQKGDTQEALAEKAGLQISYIGSVERGERNISLLNLEKIILALEISPIELFKIEETDVFNETKDKTIIVDGIRNSLINRSADEIRHINNIIGEVLRITENK